MPPGYPKSGLYARKSEQRFRGAPDLELVHSDSNRAMFTVDGGTSPEDVRAEISRRGGLDAMFDQRARASDAHWMASEPLISIAQAFHEIKRLSTVDGHTPNWIETLSTTMDDLGGDLSARIPHLNGVLEAFLDSLRDNNISTNILEASGIYSGVESLLICPETSIRVKAVELVNKWRMSQNLFPLEISISAIAAYTPERLSEIYGPIKKYNPERNGVFFGLMWAAELTRCGDFPLRLYGTMALIKAAPYLLPERDSTKLRCLVNIEELIKYFKDLRRAYPMIDGFWTDTVMSGTGSVRTNVDRWESIVQAGLSSIASTENYIKTFAAGMATAKEVVVSEGVEEYSKVLVDAVTPRPDSTPGHVSHKLLLQHDCGGCGMYRSLKERSAFFLQNASASFNRVVSEIEDEDNHVHNHIDPVSFDKFMKAFDISTRLCHGILPQLKPEVKGLYLAWPKLLCEIECNMRKVMYSEQMYVAMRETLENMEKNIATYCSDVQDSEREVAYKEIEDLRQDVEASAPEGKYMPDICDLHRIQNALMSMMCRPLKALWELDSTRAMDQQRQLDAKTAQNDELLVQLQAKGSEVSKMKSLLNASGIKLRTTSTKLEAAERAAEAKARIEIEKQKSRYYQDVEKGISETSSALRAQLDAARAEGLLHRQTLADNEKLSAEMAKMKQEMAHLKAIKSQKEKDCKLADEATRAITEGYDQLKETAATAEARNAELEADLEKALEEQVHLRNEISKLKAGKRSAGPPQLSSAVNYVNLTPTSLEEKNKKELQHLDSTMVVWKKTLAEVEAKRDATREKKEQIDLRIAHVEKQINELKEAKKPKTKPAPATTPLAQQPLALPYPIIVQSAVRRTPAEQESFPALGAATAPANTLRGDAPAFSSMRIMNLTAGGGTNMRGSASRGTVDIAGSKKGSGGGWGN